MASHVSQLLPVVRAAAFMMLGVAAIGPAFAQGPGCAQCNTITIGPFSFPNPFAGPESAPSGETASHGPDRRRSGEPRAWGDDTPSRHRTTSPGHPGDHGSHAETAAGETGQLVYVCVRKCDGSFFPLPYAGAGSTLEEICRALCPNADVALYAMPFGGTIDEGVSLTGQRYASEPNALKFQQSFEPSCACQRPGQSWADALAAAEAKYGHRAHELVVTAEVSAEMSRPRPDPKAKLAPTNAARAGDAAPAPGLDADGIDTRLKAAADAVSRETSGIRESDADASGARFGLTGGKVVDESDPDGGRRKVRILTPML